jgi:hypothetical protein
MLKNIAELLRRPPFSESFSHGLPSFVFYAVGYRWNSGKKRFETHENAFQKNFGYFKGFDNVAPFDIDDNPHYYVDKAHRKTWLVEYWKGNYWGTVGGEIGVYVYDKIVPKDQWESTWYRSSLLTEQPSRKFSLSDTHGEIFALSKKNIFWRCGMAPYRNFDRTSLKLNSITIKFRGKYKKIKGKDFDKSLETSW